VKEKVFNLFLFIEDNIIVGLGARCHQADGTDRDKLTFLQRQVKHDLPSAERFPMPKRYHLVFPDGRTGTGIQYQSYQKLAMLQRHLELFEEIFTHFGASENPLMCITPVVDDKPKIEGVTQV
jgi:hypothetical protein